MRVKQSIIVKKTHPSVKNVKQARRIADMFGKVYTSRETSTSYRFRQRPPSDFHADSFTTERLSDHISIIWGELKAGKK